jgi:hypothetical protein
LEEEKERGGRIDATSKRNTAILRSWYCTWLMVRDGDRDVAGKMINAKKTH